jgi:hypothetical protein
LLFLLFMGRNFSGKNYFYCVAILFLFGCTSTTYRYVRYNFVDINDYKIFPSNKLLPSNTPFRFINATDSKIVLDSTNRFGKTMSLDNFWKETHTVAFLAIRNDSLLYEWYNPGYSKSGCVPSFSMAKSITSMLIGCALEDGLIKSVKEPVRNYVPDLPEALANITIEDVLNMRSGISFNEKYGRPFNNVTQIYYGDKYRYYLKKLKMYAEPGKDFRYQNGNSQLLGYALEKVLSGKTITAYLQERVWTPLNMEYPASWSIFDKEKTEKVFCCLNAAARDYAKLGRLYLNRGNWNGKQVVPLNWVNETFAFANKSAYGKGYHYQWWQHGPGYYFMDGHLGQYVFLDTKKNIIYVRLGTDRKNQDWIAWFKQMSERL